MELETALSQGPSLHGQHLVDTISHAFLDWALRNSGVSLYASEAVVVQDAENSCKTILLGPERTTLLTRSGSDFLKGDW